MEKVIKDGMVAVLYSPGFGAGWYSWNGDVIECLFDPEIVNLVLEGLLYDDELDRDVVNQIEKLANEKWTGFYAGALGICK